MIQVTRIRSSTVALLVLYISVILPLAYPFVSGTTPSSSPSVSKTLGGPAIAGHEAASATAVVPADRQTSQRRFGPQPLSATSSSLDSTAFDNEHQKQKRSWRARIFPKRRQNKSLDDPSKSQEKSTEQSASFLSRLLFGYATPLLKAASKRQLQIDDAYDVSTDQKMDSSVNRLAKIHQQLQQEALNKKRTKPSDSKQDAVSQNVLLLTKALFMQQRSMLIYTAALRFLNTAIQAFPALLVSRLLQLVEAGTAVPASQALQAALALTGVLSVKMILENQFFHNVVKMATNCRGSLSGLIFDKALKLPGGGAGVTHPSNDKKGSKESPKTSSSDAAIGSGGVLNLMQSDTSIIENAALQVHTTWDGLLQLALYTYLLYRFLGSSIIYGVGVLLATIPVNSITLRVLNRLAKYENESKDARTKRTAESIGNMKLLKLFGWEDSFSDDIRKHRSEELRRHVSRGMVRALNSAISNAVPALVLVVTLRAYAKTGAPVVASTIFTAISLFNQLRFPLFFYPMLIDSLANGRNAMRRVANFLAAEEIVPYVRFLPALQMAPAGVNGVSGNAYNSNTGGSIELQHGNFLWSVSKTGGNKIDIDSEDEPDESNVSTSNGTEEEESAPALAGVDFKVNSGEVVAVVGSVGSGKSALVKGLLGELNPVPGPVMNEILSHSNSGEPTAASTLSLAKSSIEQRPTVIAHGQVAYCSQEAWLPKGSIRDAIVFGRDFDEARYMSAVRDAGLDNDIVDKLGVEADPKKGQLSHDTDVGEHGSSLSGGQRARVALARALYSNDETKIFLLDDCLAALDASVGSLVFERLTKRLRSQNAATILVTNDPSLPRRCDRTILMGKVGSSTSCSTIVDSGSYDDLIARGHDLRSISSTDTEDIDENETTKPTQSRNVKEVEATYGRDSVHYNHRQNPNDQSVQLDSPQLMKLNKKTIRVLEENMVPSNDTSVSSCHADVESQFSMETCPDSICDQQDKGTKENDDSESIFFVEGPKLISVFNDTEQSSDVEQQEQLNTNISNSPPKTKKIVSADDSMTTGAVPISTYISYFKAVRNPLLIAAMIISFFTVNGAQFFQQYTVAKWSEIAAGDAMAATLGARYMRSLVNAAGVVSVFLWLRSFLTMQVGVRASEYLHSRMLTSVFAAPLSFFDSTASGQLLSRFGKETETVDRGVPDSIQSTLFCFLQIFMSIGALASIVTPGMLVPLVAVGVLYVKTMGLFRPAARDLKRAETKTRSPIYTHFGEALRGAETIRSIPKAKRAWSRSHRNLIDSNLNVFHTMKSMDRWLSTRLETLGNIVVFAAAMASIYLTRIGRLKAGSAGWGLTQALSVTGLLTWAVRCLTDMETNMMSVLRVKELTDIDAEEADLRGMAEKYRMPKEPAKAGEALTPLVKKPNYKTALAPTNNDALIKSGWPWRGNINFKNVSMRYNPSSPLVLRGVSLTVPAGSTLGVVGRTGSGKSSLLLTLFRLMEVEPDGSIEIDGVDIRTIDLKSLRQSLAIIPQDPTLFQGTVSYNLDATGIANEADMWAALEAASPTLAKQFREDKGLNSPVTEGGKNLSQGQRQLICLARALLRKSKILVLDEATSSVDSRTDQDVQSTIRREFVDKGVTVITVAHRLETVLGYDKIAVLGAGSVLEYGSPKQLLRNRNGELRQLVDADQKSKRKGARKSDNVAVVAG